MNIDKSTCWYDVKKCPEQMILGAKGELWPVLKNSDHFPRLKDLIKTTSKDCTTLLDLGCGAAELSRLFPEYFYVGADLKQILENVSMKMNPGKNYIDFDIYNNETCSFINEYDIVVMNALIDVLEHPLFGLKNVLSNSQKYVIIHRQEFDEEGKTRIVKNPAYGSLTYHSIINLKEFEELLEEYDFSIVKEVNTLFDNSKSILLKKGK
tara:strand:- start:20422 stop:21048 length:627 start_codon:yes stop_codon:yes gene_type:complete